MRTSIDIDEDLMAAAMKATGQKTKKAAVEAALRKAVMLSNQREALDALWGMGWEGDLDAIRSGFFADFEQPEPSRGGE